MTICGHARTKVASMNDNTHARADTLCANATRLVDVRLRRDRREAVRCTSI